MTINENVIKGKWREMRGNLQKSWGKLTDNDLEKKKGDLNAISGLIQQKYGEEQEKSNMELGEIFKKFKTKKESIITDIKESIKN